MIKFRIKLEGAAPLLMHSSRLADPMNPAAKALKKVTSKRNKTDEDHEQIAQLEHQGSLYLDTDVGPFVPGENITRSLLDGARLSTQGKKIERGLFVETDTNPLGYRGPRDAAGLWADENFRLMASVKVSAKSRVMRCRPIFHTWTVEADGFFDPEIIDLEDLEAIAVTAGQLVGLGDWRPRFGRYTAKVEKLS
jgi:hypothetical protein